MKFRGSGTAGVAFSMVDEIFHPQATNAGLIIEEQKSEAVDLFVSEEPHKKITIRMKKKTK